MKKAILGLFITSLMLSSCVPGFMLKPTVTPTLTSTPTFTPTITPTITPIPTSTITPTPTPIDYPFSKLPGWFAYIDFDCQGLCTNLTIIRPDVSGRRLLTNHDYGLVVNILWSPNGRYIAFQYGVLGENGGRQLRVYDLRNHEESTLTSHYIEPVAGLSWSPDSKYLVIGYKNQDGKSGRIQRINIQSHETINLTGDLMVQDIVPVWSPDGKTIVFSSKNPNGTGCIWSMDAIGSNLKNLTPNSTGRNLLPNWSPDGMSIVFYKQETKTIIQSEKPIEQTTTELWIMDADGSNQHLLNGLGEATLVETAGWSPDGNFLGIIYGDEIKTEVGLFGMRTNTYVKISVDEGKYTALSWSPDSKAFIFMEKRDNFDRYIYLFVFNGHNPFSVNSQTIMDGVVWSPVLDIP